MTLAPFRSRLLHSYSTSQQNSWRLSISSITSFFPPGTYLFFSLSSVPGTVLADVLLSDRRPKEREAHHIKETELVERNPFCRDIRDAFKD